MASFFHASEIAGAAVEIERRGQSFYNMVASGAKDPEVKRFFEYFAGEEARHEQIFELLRDRLGKAELPAWATAEEYVQYLSALIDSHSLFSDTQAKMVISGDLDKRQAVRMAMSFEKDTILFFYEMKELLPASEKAIVDECIAEEKRHLKQLRGMLG